MKATITTNAVWEKFCEYKATHDLTRIKMRDIPDDLKDAVITYLSELSKQLVDPENESLSSLGFNERHNALLAVKLKFYQSAKLEAKGGCPRCGGTGYILAYSHVRGGRCLACNGSGK